MQELLDKRSYNAKHFLRDDGSKVLEAHAGHIHYLKDGNFEPLDWKLLWDDTRRGWFFNTHSYNPFLPEYSDGWAEFRDRFHDKDQTVKYKAIVQNIVKGELIETDETNPNFDNNIDNKGVLYRNAFGENRDYMLYNTRSSLVKVATVNNPNECTEDAVFEWEVEFPDKELFRVDKKEDAEEMTAKSTKTNTEDGKLVGYKLEKRDGKNLNTNKLTLIGNSNLDGKEWYTYLKSFKAWDSENNQIEIVARISFVDGKVILKKTIPLEFLQQAVGRVFTDTTTSFYSGAGDGITRTYGTPYATKHDNASSDTADHTGANYYTADEKVDAVDFQIVRMYAPFNTSSIPSGATIEGATVYFYDKSVSSGNVPIALVQTKQASVSAVAVGDYDECGESTANGWSSAMSTDIIEGASRLTSFSSGAYNSWTLNATGLSWIAKSGETKPTGAPSAGYTLLGLRGQNDITKTTPSARSYRLFYPSEQSGTTYDPYLSVTYSEGGGSTWTPKIIIF